LLTSAVSITCGVMGTAFFMPTCPFWGVRASCVPKSVPNAKYSNLMNHLHRKNLSFVEKLVFMKVRAVKVCAKVGIGRKVRQKNQEAFSPSAEDEKQGKQNCHTPDD